MTIPDLQIEAAAPPAAPSRPLRDTLLFDLSLAGTTGGPAEAKPDEGEAAYQRLCELRAGYMLKGNDEPPQRSLPWLIDIFLYPLSKAGLTILFLSAGVPFLLRVVLKFFLYFSGAFPPMLVFWVLSIVVHHASLLLFTLYMTWYVCECIRDSAEGGIRAVDSTAATPGFGELFGRFLSVLASAALCMAPALVYLSQTRSTDGLFWTLYGVGGFLFPMALLAVVMFESLGGLNPLLVLGSIFSTFFRYGVLVPFCYVLCLLIPVAARRLFTELWILGYALLFLAFYQLLILAHLLGRFYWRNQERLSWDA